MIGQSWTALFLAAGKSVALFDPDPAAESRVRRAVETAWPALVELGLATRAEPEGELLVCADARTAVAEAQFVQESVPERIELKHQLYAEIESALADGPAPGSHGAALVDPAVGDRTGSGRTAGDHTPGVDGPGVLSARLRGPAGGSGD